MAVDFAVNEVCPDGIIATRDEYLRPSPNTNVITRNKKGIHE